MGVLQTITKLFRLKHWSKQAFVFLGFLFGAHWEDYFTYACIAALAFSFTASSVYLYNDIEDLTLDRNHPEKCRRPIASGKVSVTQAYLLIFLLNVLSFGLCYFISLKAAFILSLYLLVNVFYSNGLKHYPFIDVLCIGSGFMLRILMGTWAIGIPPSRWILVCGTALSLFLAFSKRKLEWQKTPNLMFFSRPVLKAYNLTLLNLSLWVSSMAFLGTYIAYTFVMSYSNTPVHHLLITIPFVLFGLCRYLYLMKTANDCDCPVTLFLNDKFSLANLFFMLSMSIWILHHT